jgi:multidrug efflux system membrane fusion protein
MIRLKAEFANPDGFLWPGQFANASWSSRSRRTPCGSVAGRAEKPGGHYVFVIRKDGTVTQRPVTVDRVAGPDTSWRKGWSPGRRS